jgi:hypothetical protein
MSSACDAMSTDPDRFGDYLLANPQLRQGITNEETFERALRSVLTSDSTLTPMLTEINKKGEDLMNCAGNILASNKIQDLMKKNSGRLLKDFRKNVRVSHPTWKRTQVSKEAERRFKISQSLVSKQKAVIQTTIEEAKRPIRVEYMRAGKKIRYWKGKPREFDTDGLERKLIRSNLDKPPSEIVRIYYASGLPYRSAQSIKKFAQRMKKKKAI